MTLVLPLLSLAILGSFLVESKGGAGTGGGTGGAGTTTGPGPGPGTDPDRVFLSPKPLRSSFTDVFTLSNTEEALSRSTTAKRSVLLSLFKSKKRMASKSTFSIVFFLA